MMGVELGDGKSKAVWAQAWPATGAHYLSAPHRNAEAEVGGDASQRKRAVHNRDQPDDVRHGSGPQDGKSHHHRQAAATNR